MDGTGHRGRIGDGLVGGHGVGGLQPHADIIGFVERDRNGVDPEEVGGDQNAMNGVVGGQLCWGGHRGQGAAVGSGSRYVLCGGDGAVDRSLLKPGQIGAMGSHVLGGGGSCQLLA